MSELSVTNPVSPRAVTTLAAVFAVTAQGHLSAQVGDLAWLAIPTKYGLRMASAWRLRKPIADWTPSDFSGADGFAQDEAAFRAHVEEIAQHKRELLLLPRPETGMRVGTLWGTSQQSYHYADGVLCHSTAGHGGFHLSRERNIEVHAMLRNDDGWYEEDAEWAKVAFTFPALFTAYERRHADQSLRNDYPDAWEQLLGVTLAPGESRTKDERQFRQDHRADWIVVSAITSRHHQGFVESFAKLGGNRALSETRQYLVPSGEYQAGRFGFVIDEARHVPFVAQAA
jgi:hypothetical protein